MDRLRDMGGVRDLRTVLFGLAESLRAMGRIEDADAAEGEAITIQHDLDSDLTG
jgi:hypothetical protein